MIIIEVLNNSNVITATLNIAHWYRLLWPVILVSWIWFCADDHILHSIFINSCRLSTNITWVVWRCSIIHTINHRFHSNSGTNRLRAISISLLLKLLFKLRLISSCWRHVLLWHRNPICCSRECCLSLNFRKLPWITNSIRVKFLMISLSVSRTYSVILWTLWLPSYPGRIKLLTLSIDLHNQITISLITNLPYYVLCYLLASRWNITLYFSVVWNPSVNNHSTRLLTVMILVSSYSQVQLQILIWIIIALFILLNWVLICVNLIYFLTSFSLRMLI